MFQQESNLLLNSTADIERENYLEKYYQTLEKKILQLHLSVTEIKDLAENCYKAEYTAITSFEEITLEGNQLKHIVDFVNQISEKQQEDIVYFEEWVYKNIKELKFDNTDHILMMHQAIHQEKNVIIDVNKIQRFSKYISWWKNIDCPIFVKASLLRIIVSTVKPLTEKNEAFAAAVYYFYLKKNNRILNSILFPNAAFHLYKPQWNIALSETYNDEILGFDITALYQVCLDVWQFHLSEINLRLRDIYRKTWDFYEANPRIKNRLNYLYDKLIWHISASLEELNERQKIIFKKLIEEPDLCNKDLWLEFRCDRKTIQRDFIKMAQLGIVSTEGKGSALRYVLNYYSQEPINGLSHLYYYDKHKYNQEQLQVEFVSMIA